MTKRNVSKGQKRPFSSNGNGRSKKNENSMQYTSALGAEVIFLPMPPMLEEKIIISLEQEWPKPVGPTYTMKTATGRTEERPHDETTLETDEDRKVWADYQEEKSAWENEKGKRLLRAIQIQCIKQVNPDDEEWIERQTWLGIHIPENKYERHLHWIETEFIGGEDDIMACMTIPMQLVSGASDEEMAAAEGLFRDSIQKEALKQRAAQREGRVDV